MLLQDVLSIIGENTAVNVWRNGEIIANYNGRDAIPDELNPEPVQGITAGYFLINIDL